MAGRLNTLGEQSPSTTLASLGQRYQDYPAATFDERFGPYQAAPNTDRDLMRRLMEEQLFRQTPEGVVPGTRTWPFNYVLAGDVVPLPIMPGPNAGRPSASQMSRALSEEIRNSSIGMGPTWVRNSSPTNLRSIVPMGMPWTGRY